MNENQYKITKKELEDFAKKIYEEAYCGYLDLKDSFCEEFVSKFLLEKPIICKGVSIDNTNLTTTTNIISWMPDETTTSVVQEVMSSFARDDGINMRIESTPSEVNPYIRINYEGNESERF